MLALASVYSPLSRAADEIKAVQIYSQDQLLRLIQRNEHLSQVVLDNCQLVQDIEARAQTLKMRTKNTLRAYSQWVTMARHEEKTNEHSQTCPQKQQ